VKDLSKKALGVNNQLDSKQFLTRRGRGKSRTVRKRRSRDQAGRKEADQSRGRDFKSNDFYTTKDMAIEGIKGTPLRGGRKKGARDGCPLWTGGKQARGMEKSELKRELLNGRRNKEGNGQKETGKTSVMDVSYA